MTRVSLIGRSDFFFFENVTKLLKIFCNDTLLTTPLQRTPTLPCMPPCHTCTPVTHAPPHYACPHHTHPLHHAYSHSPCMLPPVDRMTDYRCWWQNSINFIWTFLSLYYILSYIGSYMLSIWIKGVANKRENSFTNKKSIPVGCIPRALYRFNPPMQTHPSGRHPLPQTPPCADTPRQTPLGKHPMGKKTPNHSPLGRHPMGRHPLGGHLQTAVLNIFQRFLSF